MHSLEAIDALLRQRGYLRPTIIRRPSIIRPRMDDHGRMIPGVTEVAVDFVQDSDATSSSRPPAKSETRLDDGGTDAESAAATAAGPHTPPSPAVSYSSTRMTRSLGDWRCARALTPQPEFRRVIVDARRFVRFVIASDGLWDVVAKESVAAECHRHAAPADVADALRRVAVRLSHARFGRLHDDVTIVVFDVNPSRRPFARPSQCCVLA